MTREPKKIARKRFMMFYCTIISIKEHIESRHELTNKKEVKSYFKVVLYSTAEIIWAGLCDPHVTHYYSVQKNQKRMNAISGNKSN